MKFRARLAIGAAAIGLTAAAVAAGVHLEVSRQYESARQHYLEARRAETGAVARHVENQLRSIYENIRTLALLPSVRKLDRHGTNLDDDGRETIQQVYNNLANSVSLSEVYFVPVDLDPERIDPVTGEPEEPILMFDELIVHAGRFAKAADPFAAHAQARSKLETPELEEVEIHEYRLLQQQMAWFKEQYPHESLIDGLDIPMISGPEVLTCDNTDFVHSGEDADRSGLIFSVPFYNPKGELVGGASAIILSSALRGMLPEQNFALVNPFYEFVTRPSDRGQERLSAELVAHGQPDPRLIYSEAIPLASGDMQSNWLLWAGYPDEAFYAGAEAKAIANFSHTAYTAIALLALVATACLMLMLRNMSLVRSASHVLEQRVAERTAEIRHMAAHDALTGLPNRTMLREKMADALMRVRRNEMFAVLCLDLDRFKSVNDTLGHPVGDAVLKQVTARLKTCIRDIDTVTRLGGDEFVVIQTDLSAPQQAGALAQRIIDAIAEPFEVDGHLAVIGASVGIAIAPSDGEETETLLRNADIALYRAKLDGRGAYRFFEAEMDTRLQKRRRLELALRRALAADEFVLHYQPLMDAHSEQIVGFEALLRWHHPELGMIPPSEFITIAEEIGVIVSIGEWVVRQACVDAASWPQDIKVAVNLSPVQFKSPTLVHTVVGALDRSGLAPSRLELEVTESVLLAESQSTLDTLHQLRGLGIRIAMDDFGTGYSSLSYLRSFPFDKIKIDRSFVNEIVETSDSAMIVKAVASLGTSLGMTITAEGVETAEQLAKVREHGCSQAQGYYFSHPLPLADVMRLLKPPLKAVV